MKNTWQVLGKKTGKILVQNLQRAWSSWESWWFRPQATGPLGLMRVILTSALLYMAVMRSFHLEYYTDSSWIPRSMHFLIIPDLIRPSFTWFFWPDSMGPFFHWIQIFILVFSVLGIGHRFMLFVVWVIQLAFIQRNYGVAFGADNVSALLLFLLALTNCFESWTIKPTLKKSFKNLPSFLDPKNVKFQTDILGSVGVRLIQVQMCSIYCYTGMEKLKGSSWWEGTALWNVLANPQQTTADFTFIKHFPFLIAFMTFFTIAYEVFWPVAVGSKKLKNLWLF